MFASVVYADGNDAASALGAEPAGLNVILTTADAEIQMMAMVLAVQAQRQGAEVTVLLCGEGGMLALRGAEAPRFEPADRSPLDLLNLLQANSAVIEVCALFLPQRELPAEALRDGVAVASPPMAAKRLITPGVTTLTF